MEKNSKSLSIYVESIVDNFKYEDFQPSIDKDNLKKRFVEILAIETPYWKPIQLPPSFIREWFAIEIKSFDNEDPFSISFHIGKKNIKILIFKEILGSSFDGVCYEENISIKEIWKNHTHLSEALILAINIGINANEGKIVEQK